MSGNRENIVLVECGLLFICVPFDFLMLLQVPVCSPDDILKQPIRLPFTPHNCKMVDWITG